MSRVDKDTVDLFSSIINFDVAGYMSRYKTFVNNHYPKIISYYSGKSQIDRVSFNYLDALIIDTGSLHDLISVNVDRFDNFSYWIIFEKLSEIRTKIQSIVNISKYLRSAIATSNYSDSILETYTLQQGQTLESVSRNVNENSSPYNDWIKIALNNNVIEEDYNSRGGLTVKVNKKNNQLFIQSTVDNLTYDNIYGRDFNKKITFNQTSQDIDFLNEDATLMQSVNILGNLRLNNNPRFPSEGVDKSLVVGQPMSTVSYPAVIRQMQRNFSTDDTIKSMIVTDIKLSGDSVEYQYEIRTVLDGLVDKLTTTI